METTKILVIGRNKEILAVVLRTIGKRANWIAKGFLNDKDAIETLVKESYDLVLFGGGITNEEELNLRDKIAQINPDIKIIQHFGGGSGLLYNEIQTVLDENIPST